MSRAVDWLHDGAEEWRTAVVVTDSRSLLDGLSGAGGDLRELRDKLWMLHEGNKIVTLVRVPDHCVLPGNEEAYRLAGLGSEMDQAGAPVTGAARRAQLRRQIAAEDPVLLERLREVNRGNIRESKEGQLTREARVNLTRFRTGHHPSLGRWREIAGRTEDPTLQTVPGGDGERRTSVDGMRGPVWPEGDAPARGQYVRVGWTAPERRGRCWGVSSVAFRMTTTTITAATDPSAATAAAGAQSNTVGIVTQLSTVLCQDPAEHKSYDHQTPGPKHGIA